jgi:hypothetical protein
MGTRAGTMSRGMSSGRSGPNRPTTPTLKCVSDDEAARLARERAAAKQAEKEAKQAALADKRAERAARRAEREARKHQRDPADEVEVIDEDDDLDDGGPDDEAPDADREVDAGGDERVRRP